VYIWAVFTHKNNQNMGIQAIFGGLSFFKIAKKSKFQLTFEYNGVIMTL